MERLTHVQKASLPPQSSFHHSHSWFPSNFSATWKESPLVPGSALPKKAPWKASPAWCYTHCSLFLAWCISLSKVLWLQSWKTLKKNKNFHQNSSATSSCILNFAVLVHVVLNPQHAYTLTPLGLEREHYWCDGYACCNDNQWQTYSIAFSATVAPSLAVLKTSLSEPLLKLARRFSIFSF